MSTAGLAALTPCDVMAASASKASACCHGPVVYTVTLHVKLLFLFCSYEPAAFSLSALPIVYCLNIYSHSLMCNFPPKSAQD